MRTRDLEDDIVSQKQHTETLQKKVAELEIALTDARRALDRAKEDFDRELSQKIDEFRTKYIEEASLTMMRPVSPPPQRVFSISPRRSPLMSTDSFSPFSPFSHFQGVAPDIPGSEVMRRSQSSFSALQRQDSNLSLPLGDWKNHQSGSSKMVPMEGGSVLSEDEDYFINNHPNNNPPPAGGAPPIRSYSPSTRAPKQRDDMMSVSTVAAGPSVQLVERMSAAVRRLETEVAASREELAKAVAQRDEARGEIVELMREVEGKRVVEEEVRRVMG